MKPEWMPVMLLCSETGAHGLSKVDCVTVWFFGANWNCTMSPTAAVILLGEYLSTAVPFEAPPTLTTCTVMGASWRFWAARALPMHNAAVRAKDVNCILADWKEDLKTNVRV